MSILRQQSSARLSQAVIHGDTIYLTGQVGRQGEDVAAQTRGALAAIEALLLAAGSDKSRILSVTIWLADIADFAEMNEVWDAWVDRSAPPARSTCEARMIRPDYKVEIVAVAARGRHAQDI